MACLDQYHHVWNETPSQIRERSERPERFDLAADRHTGTRFRGVVSRCSQYPLCVCVPVHVFMRD